MWCTSSDANIDKHNVSLYGALVVRQSQSWHVVAYLAFDTCNRGLAKGVA